MKPRFTLVALSITVFVIVSGARDATASGTTTDASQQAGTSQSGQRPPIRYEESVVVTADREPENIRNVGSSVSVITAEDIRRSGARWLVDVLQFAPGVTVTRQGPPGSITQVLLRGTNTSHTLFMIDGVRLNSPATGSYDLSGFQLAADQIERIEIVRGPQSTLYGSQAVGGVINVITRRGTGPGTWGVEAEGGSFSTGRFHTWVNGEAAALRYTGGVSYFDSSGFSAANESGGNSERDGYRNLTYNGRVDYESDSGVAVRGFVRGFDADLDFDGFDFVAGPIDNLLNLQTGRETYLGVAVGYSTAEFSSTVEVSATEAELESFTPDDFFSGFGLDSAVREIDWQNEIALPGDHTVVGGVEYRVEKVFSESTSSFGTDSFDESVNFIGVYVQDRIRIRDRASLAGGFRYEDHSLFGNKWTGRATGTVDATDMLRVHGSVGSAFKAPTLNDLFFPGFGNPDLQAEESVGFDVGAEIFVPRSQGRLDVTFFHNDISDLIEFDFATFLPQNLGNVVTRGLEVGGDWSPSAVVTLSGNYTYTDATPDDSDDQLIRRPRHQGGVRATFFPTPALQVWSELRAKGERFDNAVTGRRVLDAYGIINVAADYRVADYVLLRGRIDNLFDTEYEEVHGFGTGGVGGYVGLTVTLPRR